MTWTIDGPQGNEAAKVKYAIVPFTRGRGLDLGCGPSKPYPHFTGVDNGIDTKLFGIQMQPDFPVDTCERLPMFADAQWDFVFSSHLLEHIVDTRSALVEWWRVIKPGGHLVLYLPHRDLYPNIGTEGANPDHKHDFVPADIIDTMASIVLQEDGNGFDVVMDEVRDAGIEYSFLLVLKKRDDLDMNLEAPARPAKSACVVRYGGFGDQLQAANILPELKRQGYHVTFMTTPKGREILEHDPHVDAWLLQDNDQVPNGELGNFWHEWVPRFDRFINLSESVERSLLAMPGTTSHGWPHSMRHKYLDHNYGEFVADIAEVPYKSEGRFYPTDAEVAWAREFIAGLKAGFVVLWALAGSSVHKFTPHQDTIIARLMLAAPDIHVVFTGDEACQILEIGWEKEPRVHSYSHKLTIRQTLTLAQLADCVVGPETGVLNAVAFDAVPKVVFLSHSSEHNLTKYWKNVEALTPVRGSTPCYPCHRLHYSSQFCALDKDVGAALCQMNTSPDDGFQAIWRFYTKAKARAKLRPIARLLKVVGA